MEKAIEKTNIIREELQEIAMHPNRVKQGCLDQGFTFF